MKKKLTYEELEKKIVELEKRIGAFSKIKNEKEKIEERIFQAHKMEALGTLAGGIAHDFSNILYPMMVYTELTLNELAEEQISAKENLSEVLKGAKRANELVQQILAFSRLNQQKQQPIIVNFVVKEALKLIRAALPSSIKLNQRIMNDDEMVIADPTQIHQIIMNLCTNAYHAMMEKGGILDVTLEDVGAFEEKEIPFNHTHNRYLKLSVGDTGYGIKKDIIQKIFEPYFSTKEKEKGTGLGLSLVDSIVKSLDGHIAVKSQPNKGTTFFVYLPVVELEMPIRQSSEKHVIPKGSERILVVDDREQVVQMEKKMLERLGYDVTAQRQSKLALEQFRENPENYDLVITDMTMPEMSGEKLAKKILDIRPDMPIILCTGIGNGIDEKSAKRYGVKAVVLKPVEINEMAGTIRNVLDRKNHSKHK